MTNTIRPPRAKRILVEYRERNDAEWQTADEFSDYFEAAAWALQLPEARPGITAVRIVIAD